MNELNELIQAIFSDFSVDGARIPVKFLYYEGHGEPYIIYQQVDSANSFSGDDDLLGYVDYYDFDIYSKGNYKKIVEEVKTRLKTNGFVWQPSRSSADLYDADTGYYHKTINFGYLKEEI